MVLISVITVIFEVVSQAASAECIGTLPDSWANGSFPSLQLLNLSSSQLAGSLPLSWGQPEAWPNLTQLLLGSTAIRGSLPSLWAAPGAFPSLATLSLDSPSISGTVPPWQPCNNPVAG